MILPLLRNGLILFLFSLGLYLFGKGFFLHRNVVQSQSSCEDVETFHNVPPTEQCWNARRYRRAIILVIDALKYDFTIPNEDLTNHWANKMPIFENLKFRYPKQTFHARFVADSPTTTLQRLSALLTGSMPTFIDAATNFYQSSINEDNMITQMKQNRFRVVFMGDDTWMNLLPGAFYRSYPYPSFVVHDLHTVDDGVISHIYEELAAPDVDVLIGHFLGVDHCGHWHHQDHPEMSAKLTQMNQVITNVSERLMEGDLLLVLGDHGMTQAGDHGGDSIEETSASLFMYAPGSEPLVKYGSDSEAEKVISQIDLVPSLSLLLGLPIPFSSLGMLIEPLFIPKPFSGLDLKPLWMNVQQVQRYVNSSAHLSKLTSGRVDYLRTLWDVLSVDFNDTLAAASLHRAATEYLEKVQSVARSSFTIFNIPLMGLGVMHLAVACMIAIYSVKIDASKHLVQSVLEDRERFLYNWTTVLTTVVACIGPFSNSFVVNEDQASLYLLQGILLLVSVSARHSKVKMGAVIFSMIALRFLSTSGWICRYEQGCESIEKSHQSNLWISLASATILISCSVVYFSLKNAFLQAFSKSLEVQFLCSLYYIGSFSLIAFWFLDVQEVEKLRGLSEQKGFLPNISFLCFLMAEILLYLHRRFSKDRVILRLNYVLLHAIAFCNLLCIYTAPRHVIALQVLNLGLMSILSFDIVPDELQGVLIISLMFNAFFSTGHQSTFQQLQWKSGFIGFDGTSLGISGAKVLLNTFSAHILVAFLMPSVFLRRFPKSVAISIVVLRLTAQCVACFVLRNHLMLWAVFAPRLLFSLVEFGVMIIGVTFGSLFCRNTAYWSIERMGLLNSGAGVDVNKKQKVKGR